MPLYRSFWVEGSLLQRVLTVCVYLDLLANLFTGDLYTSALAFPTACGVLAVLHRQFLYSRLVGVVVMFSANVYFAGILSNSVPLFCPRTATAHCPHIGPAIAITFVLLGCALALLSDKPSNQTIGATAALAMVAFSVSLVSALICHVYMVLLGSLALLSTVLCLLIWRSSRFAKRNVSSASAAVTLIAFLLVFGAIDAAVFVSAKSSMDSTAGVHILFGQANEVEQMVDAMRTAEAGQRGYLLSHNQMFLDVYHKNAVQLKQLLDTARYSRPFPASDHHDLRNLLQMRLARLEVTVDLEQRGQHAEAVRLVTTGTDFQLSNQIESDAKTILTRLHTQARVYMQERDDAMRSVLRAVLASYLVALVLIGLALYLIWREYRRMLAGDGHSCQVNCKPARAAAAGSSIALG